MKLVQFGAGNIGRSFIGQIFARSGWEVVFVDIDKRVIDELNRRGHYIVEVRDKRPERLIIENVRGVNAEQVEKVAQEIATADLISTSVGKKALPSVIPSIARGIEKRYELYGLKPIDILICENIVEGGKFFYEGLKKVLPENFPLDEMVGLVETSIGKMVPIMPEEVRKKDPLLIYAEAFNTLIADKKGFKSSPPDIPFLSLKENMKAYVDKKLYIHNLGHAVLAYTSFYFCPGYRYIWEAAEDKRIRGFARSAMWESGNSLIKKYPEEFTRKFISEDIESLIERFKNRMLGDTIFRVGRDLYRKLGREDRLVGGMYLCDSLGIEPRCIALGYACALFFKATDDEGKMFEGDRKFHEKEMPRGLDYVLEKISGIDKESIKSIIRSYYNKLLQNPKIEDFSFCYG